MDKSSLPRSHRALDAANFCLADVRDGLGPYLAIYLLTEQHWNEARIGIVMSIAAIAGIVAQTPAGALVDATRAKRALMIVAAVIVATGSLLLPWMQGFWPVAVSQSAAQAAGVVFAPALAAVSLGIFGHAGFTRRIGRNETFNHAGNACAAAAAGALAYVWGPSVVFVVLGVLSLSSIVSILAIPAKAIDHDLARGLHDGQKQDETVSGLSVLLKCRPLLIFAACTVLFHFANAAMLPVVGQKLALQDKNLGTTLMSACIVAAQLVMVPMAMLVGAKADKWGRKPLFLVALAVLPLRGALYVLSDNPYWLVGVQLLDGVGAGIFGAIFPVIIADLMRGTGRFNIAQGAVITAQGVGAAASTAFAGIIISKAGYSAAFLALGGVALIGLVLFAVAMPETLEQGAPPRGGEPADGLASPAASSP
jgi:MFS family permease